MAPRDGAGSGGGAYNRCRENARAHRQVASLAQGRFQAGVDERGLAVTGLAEQHRNALGDDFFGQLFGFLLAAKEQLAVEFIVFEIVQPGKGAELFFVWHLQIP
jgi:hypothetical protein